MCRLLKTCAPPLAALTLVLAAGDPARAGDRRPAGKPNVIFILADDLGWTDLGCYGSHYYQTPNLDRLAAQGMRFTSAYTAGPNCAPTRAALMSGQYGPRTGVYTVGTGARGQAKHRKLLPVPNVTQLPLDRETVADALRAHGYATAMFGKWHLGNGPRHHPSRRGFGEALVSAGRHFDFKTNPDVKVPPGTYLADFLTDKAVDFIARHKDRPFFLYLPHFAVHAPLEAKKELVEKFKSRKGAGGHDNPVYAAMIASLDEGAGRVLGKLDELKLADDTVVIFSSDNGGVGGYAAAGVRARDTTNNAPLRGGKGMLYEGGVRVPWVVRWPGVVKAGTTCAEPVSSIDLYPTLLEVTGAKAKAGQILDGVSLVPLLKSAEKGTLKREALYWHFPGYLEAGGGAGGSWRTTPAGAVRSGDWKLLEFFEDGRVELYNLKDDLGQKNDLAGKLPEQARKLRQKLRDWRKAVKAPMPKPNPEFGKGLGSRRGLPRKPAPAGGHAA
jgi:arylsulfatase A-like enzyme